MDICNKYELENKHKNAQKLSRRGNRNRKMCVIQTKIINITNKPMNRKELNKKSRIRNILRMRLINIWNSSFWPENSCQVKIIEII